MYVISADGTLEPALPIDPSALDRVRLFPGTDGAPVLWTGQRWLRWQPWFGAFQPIADAPTRGPRGTAIASGDPGLALWLDDRADTDESVMLEGQLYVRGYRFATRSRFGTVRNPLLVDGPTGLAPDRVVGTPGSSIRFVDGRGLELGPGASAFVTDVTFKNVSVVIDGGDTPYHRAPPGERSRARGRRRRLRFHAERGEVARRSTAPASASWSASTTARRTTAPPSSTRTRACRSASAAQAGPA